MAYDKLLFKRLHAFGLTADAAHALTTLVGDLQDSTTDLETAQVFPASAIDDLNSATATPVQIADKVNELLSKMRGSGLLTTE